MSKAAADTPLMIQHNAIKQRYPDAILLFRVGDFYETFGKDAVVTSQVLGITLTKRNNGQPDSSELAGFPHHALETYLHKLVKAGHRVAICDQLEDPKLAKGIVKRGVTELVTPGITTNDKLLDLNCNNFLCAIHFAKEDAFGISFLDISTGEFFVAEGNREYVDKLLQSLQPAEVIFQRNQQRNFKEYFGLRFHTYTLDEWIMDEAYATETLMKHFAVHSLKGYGVEDMHMGLVAAGAVLHYLRDTEHPNLQHITGIQRLNQEEFMWLDRFTIRNLELLHSSVENGYTLLRTLDNTVSPMGARLLRRWITLPLKDINRINERLNAVAFLLEETELRTSLSQLIKSCGDVERMVSKVPLKKINPREFLGIAKGLEAVDIIKSICSKAANSYIKRLGDLLNPSTYLASKILMTLVAQPPVAAIKGGIIAEGVHAELDELRSISTTSKDYLARLQDEEAAATGISSLKIGFNNVFGYYLEVTNMHKAKVPQHWMRKQTLANAERYITPELKEYEEKITGADDKILAIEMQLFEGLLTELMDYLSPLQVNGQTLAVLDCLCTFARNALHFKYQRPEVHDGLEMQLTESRHPVIERHLPAGETYVSNDLVLDPATQQIIILTGPNMSGKSALLRQTALITLMAHMGSFVPATVAKIPLTDKIFTRVGASDNLSGGESTFMVEMNETASIINNISQRSLVLLDEIGRGTSTYDGISIAWSIVEHLQSSDCKPKTFFATHYHELNELENKLEGVRNYHITNKEVGNKIIFLRKLAEGGSRHSFGIHVAKMAGMPPSLINRANEILGQLESFHAEPDTNVSAPKVLVNNEMEAANKNGMAAASTQLGRMNQSVKNISTPKMQLSIFDAHTETFNEIRRLLENFDINRLTPVEALLKLNEIKGMLK
jgi:DNA mismatch repair protein MutS